VAEIFAKAITLVPLKDIKLNPKNRNKHPADQIDRLVKIIKETGFRRPGTISNRTGFLVCGECRYLAAKKIGLKEIPIMHQDYADAAQELADAVADNAIDKWANLDTSGINAGRQRVEDFDLDLLGIKDFRIVEPTIEPQCDEDDAPHVRSETISKPGDIWLLGRHRLLCGDATIADDVAKMMGAERADLVWTDPPYNVAYEGKTAESLTIQNDEMSGTDFYQFLYDAYLTMFMFTKPGGGIYVAHADTEGVNFRKAMMDAGWLFKQCLVWVKQTFVMGRQDYHWKHEPILYGWAPGAAHTWIGDRKQSTVLEFSKPARNGEHPTMKPVELIEYCLSNSVVPGGLVLDLFGGSGSTLIACEKTGQQCTARGARSEVLRRHRCSVGEIYWSKGYSPTV
jgi:DNA modification methylase